MNKLTLILSFLFFLLDYSLFAQSADYSGNSVLETQVGLVRYSYFENPAPSINFNLVTPVGEYLFLGAFAGGFASINASQVENNIGRTISYSPMGVRVGTVLRGATNPSKLHFYGEVIGALGKTFDTGFYESSEDSRAMEYMIGTNVGLNFKTKGKDFFGLYVGFNMGILNFDSSGEEAKVSRIHFGLTYHNKL